MLFRSPDAEKKLPKLSRGITSIFLLLVLFAATDPPDMIIWLNLLSLGGTQAVFLWPLLLGLYWKKASAAGALTSMTTGLITYTLLSIIKPDMGGIHAIVPSLTLSLIAFVCVSAAQSRQASAVRPLKTT